MIDSLISLVPWLIGIVFGNAVQLTVDMADSTWQSPNGFECSVEVLSPLAPLLPADKPVPTAIYLKHLQSKRIGTVSDSLLIEELRNAGLMVVVLDFRKDVSSGFPQIHRTLSKFRDDLFSKRFKSNRNFDSARIYMVPEGCRLIRDIEFARDNERTLAMDIIYPAEPKQEFGTLLEFSCDNTNRFGNGSLSICSDTLLDGFATQGFAVCMADHPVNPPYKGFDPMPVSAERTRLAVRKLRQQVHSIGGNGKLVSVGFSRGSGMALLLTTPYLSDPQTAVDGAVLLSGRFTYLNLLESDKMIPRYRKAWGERDANLDVWRSQGALDYLDRKTVPMFLSINAAESPDALHQMEVLKRRLAELESDFEFALEVEMRGHKVPLAPAVLAPLSDYLHKRLD